MANKWFAYQPAGGAWIVTRVDLIEVVTGYKNGVLILFRDREEEVATETYDLEGFVRIVLADSAMIDFMADSES